MRIGFSIPFGRCDDTPGWGVIRLAPPGCGQNGDVIWKARGYDPNWSNKNVDLILDTRGAKGENTGLVLGPGYTQLVAQKYGFTKPKFIQVLFALRDVHQKYFLVIWYIAIENGHRNSEFSH